MARGDGRAGLCAYVLISACMPRWKDTGDVFISFKGHASFRVYENKLCTPSEGRCLPPPGEAFCLSFASREKKPHSARVATPRRENKGPRCLTVRHIRSRDLMSDAEMLRTGFALSDEKLSWCFVKNVAIMMKHHSVFGLDCFVDVSG